MGLAVFLSLLVMKGFLLAISGNQWSTMQTLTDAYRLLARAATFRGDSRLCDTLSGAIYGIWQSRRSQGQLAEANRILEEERARTLHSMAASAGNR